MLYGLEFVRLTLILMFAPRTSSRPQRDGERGELPQWVVLTALGVVASITIGTAIYSWVTTKSTDITSR